MDNKSRIYLALSVIAVIILFVTILWIIGRTEETPIEEGPGTGPSLKAPEDIVERLAEKGDVSQGAEEIKQKLVAPLGGRAGTLFENEEVRIDYIPPIDPFPDIFSIEIFIEDSTRAKQTAVEWFSEQGFSDKDICELPISFFLSNDVRWAYIRQERVFDPLLEDC
jgi:hypothetical protein